MIRELQAYYSSTALSRAVKGLQLVLLGSQLRLYCRVPMEFLHVDKCERTSTEQLTFYAGRWCLVSALQVLQQLRLPAYVRNACGLRRVSLPAEAENYLRRLEKLSGARALRRSTKEDVNLAMTVCQICGLRVRYGTIVTVSASLAPRT